MESSVGQRQFHFRETIILPELWWVSLLEAIDMQLLPAHLGELCSLLE